jgi:hypothetical protein
MTTEQTEQQLELKEIKKLISDRFDKQDEKINDIRIELAGIKVDTTWIKWLFGGASTFGRSTICEKIEV